MPLSGRPESAECAQARDLHGVFNNAWRTCMRAPAGAQCDDTPEMHAFLFEFDAWHPWLEEALPLLSQAERDRVRRKMRANDRDELVLAYGLHRLVLAQVLQNEPEEIALYRDPSGRPRVQGDPVQTSLSHAGGAFAVALNPHGFVGIDLEPRARAGELPEIASSVMHSSEVAALAAMPDVMRAEALLALWVRKEALLKASGIGLVREMHSFPAPIGPAVGLPCADGTQGHAASIHMLEAGERWVAAIAGPTGSQVQTFWLSPGNRLAGMTA